MIILKSFHFPSREEEEDFFLDTGSPNFQKKNFRTVYSSKYPFVLFRERGLPDLFEFGDITIFSGDNGSGKSTLLNVMAEKLGLRRGSRFNRSDYFDDYVELCRYESDGVIPTESAVITSDDVFDRMLDVRRLNDGIDDRRGELIKEWIDLHGDGTDTSLHGIEDYDRWKRVHEARNRRGTQSQFIRSHLMQNVDEHSNGESALAFFVEAISGEGLYLLDEPENSLSPYNQIQLKYYLEDSVRNHGCQFILSTHSPFLLSLRYAKIYDIDRVPVATCRWTELENVRTYHDFFREHEEEF